MRTEPAHTPQPTPHGPGSSSIGGPSTVGRWLRAVGCRLKALFGMPDYARYLAHQQRCHPEAAVLSEKEFVRAEFERRYAGGGGRCC